MDDTSSLGHASAAVAMANDAISNARRAASEARNRRENCGSTFATTWNAQKKESSHSQVRSGTTPADLDFKSNDDAFVVIATLVTERLLPKLEASPGCTHYTMTADDAAFFQKMLPYSVRRCFVDALRYRLQLIKSGDPRVSQESPLGRLTMQCQLLGLERDTMNVLLDLSQSPGMSYPVNFKNQGPVAYGSRDEGDEPNRPSQQAELGPEPSTIASTKSNTNHVLHQPAMHSSDWEQSAESLARQQIIAEINETKFLMRGSVTPDAIGFWKKHLDDLNEKLMTLNTEEQRDDGKTQNADAMMSGLSSFGMGQNADYELDMYSKVNTQFEYKNPSSPVDTAVNSNANRGGGGDRSIAGTTQPPITSPKKIPHELPVCDVVAPSDLPGGYMFEAQLGSKKFLATVPPGGVTKGQRFVSTMRELETIEIPVPLGGWRDSVVDCFTDGICHPLFLNSLVVPCIALGQIMTRNGLDWQGNPANKLVSSLSCTNMTVFLTFWLSINASAAVMLRISWDRLHVVFVEHWIPLVCFNAFFLIYFIYLTMNVRLSIRNKYQIQEGSCEGAEDCLCATFCLPCTICQMGRHTSDYDTYRATCCNATGLPRQVELAPVTFYEDQYATMEDGQVV